MLNCSIIPRKNTSKRTLVINELTERAFLILEKLRNRNNIVTITGYMYSNLINSKTSKKTKDKRLKTKGSKHYEKQS
jgi:hypothetical protein